MITALDILVFLTFIGYVALAMYTFTPRLDALIEGRPEEEDDQ